MASERVIICVHGAGAKPALDELLSYWRAALKAGLARDRKDLIAAFEDTRIEMIYFADRVPHRQKSYDANLDRDQRQKVIERLSELKRARDFRRRYYEEVPGKSAVKEFVMDTAASLGLARLVWPRLLPELAAYWKDTDGWAEDARAALAALLKTHAVDENNVLLISHCMGSVIAYDALCDLELERRLSAWLTLGAPLSSNLVRARLRGPDFPNNLSEWHNVAAEDDYVCHDKTMANDFAPMLERRMIGDITDHTIYNLAVRYGRSNPHHSAGYLIHPRVTAYLADFLSA